MESKNLRPELSPAQKEAVTWGKGPLMVLAGPGSGKTSVITERVRYLIESGITAPSSILVVTFSKAAAREMEARFLSFHTAGEGRVTFGTFHSFFFGILRKAYGYSANQVASEEERMNMMMEFIRKNRLDSEDKKTLALNLLSEIATVKEERAELQNYYSVNCPADLFREIFRSYEEGLGNLKKIDYEDMLLMTFELLKEREEIRKACADRYRFILVDEFQDINRLQYEIVKMLAGSEKNLTIVGDDDQSIYRFRGAKPEIMLGFHKDFPGAGQVLLDRNYRSVPEIVRAAGKLISHNRKRFPKEIKAVRGKGTPVKICFLPEPPEEARYVADRIKIRHAEGIPYGEMAVLYRTNLQPRLTAARLMEENIPFRIQEQLPDLMEHWIARDLSAYLKLSRGMGERADLVRIINRPNRYVKREAMLSGAVQPEDLKAYYAGQKWMTDRLDRLRYDLRSLSRLDVYQALLYIRKEIGYDAFLSAYAGEHHIEESELLEIADEITDSGDGFRTPLEWFSHMKEFRKNLREKKQEEKAEEDQVRLMTFHASKGLEFRAVFIIDVNQGVVPHRKAKAAEEKEEERRAFYVAMTRAKDYLEILSCKKRFCREAKPSEFLAETGMDALQ